MNPKLLHKLLTRTPFSKAQPLRNHPKLRDGPKLWQQLLLLSDSSGTETSPRLSTVAEHTPMPRVTATSLRSMTTYRARLRSRNSIPAHVATNRN